MLKNSLLLSFTLGAFMMSSAAHAENYEIGGALTTLGAGIEVGKRINDRFGVRGALLYLPYDESDEIEGIEYEAELEFLNLGLLADWYPTQSGFRITGGLFIGNNEMDLTANNISSVTVGDTVYTTSEVNSLNGKIEVNDFAPYLGLGWDGVLTKDSRWNLGLDFGVKFHGSPEVSYTASGSLVTTDAFQNDLDAEVAQVESDLDSLQYYPVVGLNLKYIF